MYLLLRYGRSLKGKIRWIRQRLSADKKVRKQRYATTHVATTTQEPTFHRYRGRLHSTAASTSSASPLAATCRILFHTYVIFFFHQIKEKTIEMMEFLSFDVSSKRLALERCTIPKPRPNEVLIKVSYSGICGTDLHILEGSFPCKKEGKLTLGHEFSGIIQEIGSEVKTLRVGDRIAVDPNSGCNKCDFCHNGKYHFCENGGINSTIGIFRDGGWATHALVPEDQVHAIPEGVEMPQAALSEPLSCVAHGWDKINPVSVGTKTLVIGSGIIGLLWACVLHLHGLRKTVVISEPQEKRREAVKKLDLEYEVKGPSELKGRQFDLAVDCSGSGPAMEAAVPLLRRGGRLCVFGVANPKATLTLHPFEIYMKELMVVGVNINPFTFPKGLALVQAMADRYLTYEKLGIRVYKLSEYKEALEALKNGDASKAVFKL